MTQLVKPEPCIWRNPSPYLNCVCPDSVNFLVRWRPKEPTVRLKRIYHLMANLSNFDFPKSYDVLVRGIIKARRRGHLPILPLVDPRYPVKLSKGMILYRDGKLVG